MFVVNLVAGKTILVGLVHVVVVVVVGVGVGLADGLDGGGVKCPATSSSRKQVRFIFDIMYLNCDVTCILKNGVTCILYLDITYILYCDVT